MILERRQMAHSTAPFAVSIMDEEGRVGGVSKEKKVFLLMMSTSLPTLNPKITCLHRSLLIRRKTLGSKTYALVFIFMAQESKTEKSEKFPA